ncbi:MAG TPA: thiamine ABC transporter substrate-binding protein [Anaerolineales bacterium]|nr:thiamine ABC transporter substrate-binding protein [Anaerolineales bacterium]
MKRFSILLSIFLFAVASCAPKPAGPQNLTVMTHDSFAVSDSVIQAFEQANDVKVTFVKGGDAGEMLNKAILSKSAPLADVLYGVDNTLLSEALSADIYEPYASPALKNIPAEFQLDPSDRALPVDHGYVCVVYDKTYFSTHNLSAPQSLEDLMKPEYKGLLVMENPATSSPGLDFLFATIKHFGDPDYLGYWKQLRANGLVVVDGWETAYYTNFTGASGQGAQAMVVSYATDPAYEVMSAPTPIAEASVAAVVGPDTCFHQIEFVGILKGTQHLALAQKFVDFMLGAPFQADVPGQMAVYPVALNIALPDAFTKFAPIPHQPAALSSDDIEKNRDAWIQAWTDAVLH